MKKFSAVRPLSEIKQHVLGLGWKWDDEKYQAGSDWITFEFFSHGRHLQVLFCPFNGRFLVMLNDDLFSETSTEMDGVDWYDALLDFIYVPRRKTAQRGEK